MKLLAYTDDHGDPEMHERIKELIKSESPDMIVHVGDFTFFGHEMEESIQRIADLGLPVVLIHGNHEDEGRVVAEVDKHKNIHWAHGRVIEVNGVRFFGFGGHGFRHREPELEHLHQQMGESITGSTIVLSHPPPHETTLDQVEPGWHVGCESLNDLVRARLPMLVLTGHIHECFHERDMLYGVPVINPGPDGEIIEVED